MKCIKMSGGPVKFIFLLLVAYCFYCNTAIAFQSENLEGYYVDMRGDTSFVTLEIPMYLEEPDYILLQYDVKALNQTGGVEKLTFKNTKSYGFAFHNKLIQMVSFKKQPFKFLRLLDKADYKLPDDNLKLFIRYTFPDAVISSLLKEPLSKQYFFQQSDSERLIPVTSMFGLNNLSNRLIEKKEK